MGRSTNRVGHGLITAALGVIIGLFADGISFRQTVTSVQPQPAAARVGGGAVPSPAADAVASAGASGSASVSNGNNSNTSNTAGVPAELASMSAVTDGAIDIARIAPSGLESLEQRFEAIAGHVAPSVVAISAAVQAFDSDELLRAEELNTQKLQAVLDRTTRIVGTGFIIDSEGYILTNEHVIGEAEQLWVTTDDHRVYPAIVVGSDPRGDLAVLKVPAANLPAVRFASYGSISRGQWTIALGNPYGLAGDGEMCMSVGVVSATDRSLPKLSSKENRLYSNLIQTTAQINPGNSGGPLFDLNGDVIGVNTAVILPQKSTNGIGFAVPITPQFIAHVQQLKEGREIVYGYLGVTVSTLTDKARKALGLQDIAGARIDSIEQNSPADQSPLRVGDVVVELNGELIHDGDQFIRLIGAADVDQPSRMVVYRDGIATNLQVMLRKRQLPNMAVTRQSQRLHWRGMLLGTAPQNWTAAARPAGDNSGLVVLAISADSPMLKQGVKVGSVLSAVAGQRVSTIAQLQRIINDVEPERCSVQLADIRTTVTGQVVSVE